MGFALPKTSLNCYSFDLAGLLFRAICKFCVQKSFWICCSGLFRPPRPIVLYVESQCDGLTFDILDLQILTSSENATGSFEIFVGQNGSVTTH